MAVAVDIQDVSKRFRLFHERGTSLKERLIRTNATRYTDLWALKDVGFEVAEGETLGILGHNGSGKSTLLKCICGVLQPTSGQIVVRGKLAGLLELGAGFQPELSGRDNIYLNGSMLGLSRKDVDAVFDDIVGFAELEQFIDNQVKFYSSGMYVRLGFAVAVNVDPDILVVDEVLAVGDERFQRKCLDRIRQFQEDGRTIIFVSHSPDQVRSICQRAVVLDEGKMIGDGPTGQAVRVFRESLLEIGDESFRQDDDDASDTTGDRLLADHRPVRLTTVRASYPGCESAPYLKSQDPVSIHIGFHADAPVEGVKFGIEIFGPKGGVQIRTDSDIIGREFDLAAGDGEEVFHFDTWPYTDGAFKVGVGIQNRLGGITYDWREEAVTFEVLYEGRASGRVNLPVDVELVTGVQSREDV